MGRTEHLRLMAQYNEWMNAKLYAAAQGLSHEALVADRQAFFGSILGTLNHLAVADTLWLKRYANHPAHYPALEPLHTLPTPSRLDQLLYSELPGLTGYRTQLDQIILEWTQSITEHDLDQVLHYASTKGVPSSRNFFALLVHFFNHQTHHRGQATTLLSQAGIDVGITDLLTLIPESAPA